MVVSVHANFKTHLTALVLSILFGNYNVSLEDVLFSYLCRLSHV
jgi:hypothetical protein